MELNTLKAALEKEGLIAEIHNNAVEAFRDWSYESGANHSTDWYVPADDIIEAYSDTVKITFAGTEFVAADEFGEQIAIEPVEDGDIKAATESMACTIADILPERDIAAEHAEARADYLISRFEDAGAYV